MHRNPPLIAPLPSHLQAPALSERDFDKFRQLAYEKFGLSLSDAKHELVAARLLKRLRELKFRTFAAYYDHVVADATGESLIALIDGLSTNHTGFLREPEHFDFLRTRVLPALRERSRIQIFSAPCATGEEPYSILFTLLNELGFPPKPDVSIRAIDISTRALATARTGAYPIERVRGLPVPLIKRFMKEAAPGVFEVRPELRRMIDFARVNLIEPLREPHIYSVIFCRNLMIYFDRPTQERVVAQLSRALEPGGYFFTGHSESLMHLNHDLEYVQPAVYRKPCAGSRGERR